MNGPARIRLRAPVAVAPAPKSSLCDALDTLLDTGAVVAGEIIVQVAGVDLLYVGLELVATSWETARGPAPKQEPP